MTYEESVRVLLRGTCGANVSEITRGTRVGRRDVQRFVAGHPVGHEALVAMGWFVFRRMNVNILLSPADLQGQQQGAD